MSFEAAEHRTFTARMDAITSCTRRGRWHESTLLVATLHGFGSNPEAMLRLTSGLVGDQHQTTWATAGPRTSTRILPCNCITTCCCTSWMKPVVLAVFLANGGCWSVSRSVGMNYRFAATHPAAVRGVIGICGGIPKN